MPHPATRVLALAALVATTASCAAPGATLPGVGYVGVGTLPLDVLAVTAIDAETGNKSSKVAIKWSTVLGTKTYEVWRKFGTAEMKVLTTTERTPTRTPRWPPASRPPTRSARSAATARRSR